MDQPVEIADGVWVLHEPGTGRNTGILVGEGRAVIVDPSGDRSSLEVIDAGLTQQGRNVVAVVSTSGGRGAEGHWPAAERIEAVSLPGRSPLPLPHGGWELVPLSAEAPERLAVYHPGRKMLFCGEMLADTQANEAVPSLGDGSRSYIDALKVVRELDVKLLVPSTGSVARGKRSIRNRIEADHNYVYDVRRLVISSIMGEASLDRVLAVTTELHDDFPLLEDHLANIRGVWAELAER